MNNISIFIEPSYFGYVWLIIALIFLFAEMATPGLFFFIAFAIGSCCAAITAFLNYSFMVQCIVVIISFAISFWILRHYFSVMWKKRVETNIDAMIGKKGIIVKTIEEHKTGFVKVEGETWSALSQKGVILKQGTVVIVVDIKGNRLIVQGE
ncbi:NfeD family protein [Candidatus Babeliales bacterium]|nr:NfeD family protein [Candidatus Babeliales bacterium]